MRREVPLPWQPYFDKKNVTSVRDLGRKLSIHQSTAARAIFGEASDPDTLQKIADYFGLSLPAIQRLRGETPRQPFRLPAEADNLTPKQREAVRAIVQAMVNPGAPVAEPSDPAAYARAARKGTTSRSRGEDEEPF